MEHETIIKEIVLSIWLELLAMQLEVAEGCLLSPETEDGKGHGWEGGGGQTSV